jgi:hypothetical protein
MRYLLLNSILLLSSCTSAYKNLQKTTEDVNCITQFRPQFANTLYSTQVDVLKHHLSGLLFFKQMPDSSLRVVFASEMGFKFFDFEFTKEGGFIKHYVTEQMDKKSVVKTLRGDFELALLHPDLQHAHVMRDSKFRYVVVPTEKGNNYYITDSTCSQLLRLEKSSRRKPVVKAWLTNYKDGVPDSILIRHQQFKFNISLQRVQK